GHCTPTCGCGTPTPPSASPAPARVQAEHVHSDLGPAELRRYRSSAQPPPDLAEFWGTTLEAARAADRPAVVERVETGLRTVDTFDVSFAGFDGQPVRAWLRRPAGVEGRLPTVVEYVGYGGGRGHVLSDLVWASAGYAH